MPDVTCPSCEGRQQTFCHVNSSQPSEHGFRYVPCYACRGKGTVSEEQKLAMEHGRRVRDERVAAGLSLREGAAKLGITMRELSDMERGYRHG